MKTNNRINFDEIHLGNMVKAELQRQGRTITWLAAQVNCTRENLYKVFRRSWIYTDLLFKISAALNHDFFKDCSDYYQSKNPSQE